MTTHVRSFIYKTNIFTSQHYKAEKTHALYEKNT